MVNKEEFRNAVRDALGKVPVETRRRWDDNHLFAWWIAAQKADAHLKWDRSTGSLWQHVKRLCANLIGPDAE